MARRGVHMNALPCLGRGRPTEARRDAYAVELATFCAQIIEIRSGLDFAVSSRGWCYLLEGEGLITKGEFDPAQRLINECRKTGALPLDICAVDDRRSADGLIERAAQLTLKLQQLDAEIAADGLSDHDTRYYICWSNALNRTLARLGTKPAAARAPGLPDYLAAKGATA